MRRILDAEEKAHISMAVVLSGLHEVRLEDEIGEYLVGDESNVKGRAISRLVIALRNKIERNDVVGFGNCPGFSIGHGEIMQVRRSGDVLFVERLVSRGSALRLLCGVGINRAEQVND